jgi:hypothetical protein
MRRWVALGIEDTANDRRFIERSRRPPSQTFASRDNFHACQGKPKAEDIQLLHMQKETF